MTTTGPTGRQPDQKKAEKKHVSKRTLRRYGRVLFVIYLIALTYFLFFAEWYDHQPGKHWQYHYNFVPFMEIRRFIRYGSQLGNLSVFFNLFGNILGFLPFGFFLPVISPKMHHAARVILLGAVASTAVELIQLVTRTGICDIDDVILNTIGAAAGYGLFHLTNELRRKVYGR